MLMLLFQNNPYIYFNFYILDRCNRMMLNCLMHEGNFFILLLNNTGKLFMSLVRLFDDHLIITHFHINNLNQSLIINVPFQLLITTFSNIKMVFHIDLFNLINLTYRQPMDFSFSFQFNNIKQLYLNFYQQFYHLNKVFQPSIIHHLTLLTISLQYNHSDIQKRLSLIHNNYTFIYFMEFI